MKEIVFAARPSASPTTSQWRESMTRWLDTTGRKPLAGPPLRHPAWRNWP